MLVTVIMAFSSAMKKAGAMDGFARALASIVPSKRLTLAIAPLIIGTLPMPGGAILSAPLVDAFDPERERGNHTLSTTNYWFRHNLELAWPLYPAFILTSTMAGLSVGRLMLLNLYAAPLLFVLGLLFILPKKLEQSRQAHTERKEKASIASVLSGFAPLAIVLGGYAILDALGSLVLPRFGMDPALASTIGHYVPIFLSITAASLYLGSMPQGRGAFKGCISASTLKLSAVVAGIKVFAALLAAGGVAQASAAELASAGIPAIAAAAVLPFVAGLVSGVGFGYVGLSFPIVLGLFPAGSAFPLEAAVVLAGVFGYAGMMFSPLHVCMVVSAQHFGSGLPAIIRRFTAPLGAFMVLGCAYALVLGYFFL